MNCLKTVMNETDKPERTMLATYQETRTNALSAAKCKTNVWCCSRQSCASADEFLMMMMMNMVFDGMAVSLSSTCHLLDDLPPPPSIILLQTHHWSSVTSSVEDCNLL